MPHGKASFDEAKIVENAAAFIDAVRKARPTGAKGQYVKKLLSSTMGAGVFVEDVRPIGPNNRFLVAVKPGLEKGVNAICRCPTPVRLRGPANGEQLP